MKHIGRALLKVVHLIAQVGLLRVIEGDRVLAGSNRQRILVHAVVVVAVNLNLFLLRLDHSPERLILHGLCIDNRLTRVLINVVHRVAQVVPLRVIEGDRVLAGSNRQRILVHAVVVVAVNLNLFLLRLDHSPERLILHGLCIDNRLTRVLINVVHRVAQVVPLRVIEGDHVLAGSNRQLFFRFHAVVVVAVDINLFACRRDLSPERLILHGLFIVKLLVRSLLKVLHRVAQVGSLRVVEGNHVLAGSNRQLFFRFHAVVVVAVDINLFACRRDLSPERLILHGLFIVKLLVRSLLKVLHRVAQVGLLLVIDLNNVLTFIRSNRQRAVLRLFELIPIFRLESESVFIDLTSVQRMDGIGFGIVYFAVVVMLNPIAVGVRPIVHVDNRVFATYELLHWIIITRISVAGYIFNIFFF